MSDDHSGDAPKVSVVFEAMPDADGEVTPFGKAMTDASYALKDCLVAAAGAREAMPDWGDKDPSDVNSKAMARVLTYNAMACALRALNGAMQELGVSTDLCDWCNQVGGGLLEGISGTWVFGPDADHPDPDKKTFEHLVAHMTSLSRVGPFDETGNVLPFSQRPRDAGGGALSTVQMAHTTANTVSREDLFKILSGEMDAPDPRLAGAPMAGGKVDKGKLN